MMQFSEEYRDALDTYLDDRPEEIARKLIASFETFGNRLIPPYTLALYTDEGGYAIMPIGIEEPAWATLVCLGSRLELDVPIYQPMHSFNQALDFPLSFRIERL